MENRKVPVEIDSAGFRKAGHALIDQLADFFESIRNRSVTTGETPAEIESLMKIKDLPEQGRGIESIISEATQLLIKHSLFNGHPKFFGYITGSPAPIGALADMLAASINPNVGANILSPVATAIEKQTIKWLANLIGLPEGYGGILVSGGNMANMTAFVAARTAVAGNEINTAGLDNANQKLTIYSSKATHTWIEKAAVLFGHGKDNVRYIETRNGNCMDTEKLEQAILDDLNKGYKPFFVCGTAGDVSTGAVDDLNEISQIAKRYSMWFHVDGAYGIPAAAVPEYRTLFAGIDEADSIAMDPHKWLYCPLEAGCTLIKNPEHLLNTFSSHPDYYNFGDASSSTNFYEYGIQNSRGFRALKVWMALQQAGREGYVNMIGDDIRLAKLMFDLASEHDELEAATHSLSITTLRYVPVNFSLNGDEGLRTLNELNENILNALQKEGEAFLSNAIIDNKYFLRACIVNFRTTEKDIRETIDIIVSKGRDLSIY